MVRPLNPARPPFVVRPLAEHLGRPCSLEPWVISHGELSPSKKNIKNNGGIKALGCF